VPGIKTVFLTLTCLDAPAVQVYFEPEGAEHELVRGDWLRVETSGPADGEPEISYLPDGLIVGAWAGAKTRVRNRAGDELPT
jgi:hypothetical protein